MLIGRRSGDGLTTGLSQRAFDCHLGRKKQGTRMLSSGVAEPETYRSLCGKRAAEFDPSLPTSRLFALPDTGHRGSMERLAIRAFAPGFT